MKPVREFGRNKARKDGLQVYCSECMREIMREARAIAPRAGKHKGEGI